MYLGAGFSVLDLDLVALSVGSGSVFLGGIYLVGLASEEMCCKLKISKQ